MATTESTNPEALATPKPRWYSLNPRHLSRSRFMRVVLLAIVLYAFSIVPLWCLLWYFPVYGLYDFLPVTDMHNHHVAAWHWIEGHSLRVYYLPGIKPAKAEIIAAGARELLHDTGLQFTVTTMPAPPAIQAAYAASCEEKTVNGSKQRCVNFGKLEKHLVSLRTKDPHADMLVVDTPISEYWWAHGMATFVSGVAVFEAMNVDTNLGKHETGHLMGYLLHDSQPLFVIGYRWEGWPWSRHTLMMLTGDDSQLSPRASDALHYFWRGIEDRTGKRYLAR